MNTKDELRNAIADMALMNLELKKDLNHLEQIKDMYKEDYEKANKMLGLKAEAINKLHEEIRYLKEDNRKLREAAPLTIDDVQEFV